MLAVAHGGVIRALERQFGIDDGLVPNLGGRVVDVHEHWLTPGAAPRAGRRRPARRRRSSCDRAATATRPGEPT